MARKLNFDPPAAETEIPPAEVHEATPQRARPLLGLERSIKQSGALARYLSRLAGYRKR